jgi:hypothetical protein
MSKSGIPIVSDVAKAVKPIVQPIAKAIRPLAPILPFIPIPGMFGLSSLLTKSLLTGALGGMEKSGRFNLGRGLKSGLLAYGVGSLMNPATAAKGTLDGSTLMPDYDPFGSASDLQAAGISGSVPPPPPSGIPVLNSDISTMPVSNTLTAAQMGPDVLNNLPAEATAAGPARPVGPAPITSVEGTGLPGLTPGAAGPAPTTAQSIANLAGAAGETALTAGADLAGKALDYAVKNPLQATLLGTTAYGGIKTMQEAEKQKEEAQRIIANREREKAEKVSQAEQFLRDYPLLYQRLTTEDVQRMGLASGGMAGNDPEYGNEYEEGGLAYLAGGGMPPRYLRGGGDGMSDSIPARIGGKQEARLADGEFVVPADVVSHIGNGSSNAGAKKLYAMMDRARQARTGRTRQAPAVNAQRYLPA